MAEAQKAKAKRGDGPIAVKFIDAANAEKTRVPLDAAKIKVVQKAGAVVKEYDLAKLPQNILVALAAGFVGKRFDQSGRNGVNDKGEVIHATDKVWNDLIAGVIFSRKEGTGGPGKSFDMSKWLDALKRAGDKKKKPVSDVVLKQMESKIASLAGKARTGFLNKLRRDSNIALALKEIELEREKASGKVKKADEFDAFSMFN